MRADGPETIDLDALALRSGQAEALELTLQPVPPVVGGEALELDEDTAALAVEPTTMNLTSWGET